MSETMTRVGERLAQLIEEETAQLRSRTPGAIAGLQKEKGELARIWGEGLAQIKAGKLVPGPHRPALAKAAARLDAALVQNERVLKAVTVATDRVVAAIADAVREQRSCGVGYGMRRQAPRTRAPASGIAVDRKL
jgi:hypothetical protein